MTTTQTEIKHTPGPWASDLETETFDGAVLDGAVYVNHGSGKGGQICLFPHNPDDGLDVRDPETIANAALSPPLPRLWKRCGTS